jgi:hypothetical protein
VNAELADFVQRVPRGGFAWYDGVPAHAHDAPEHPLVRVLIASRTARTARRPLEEEPALYRVFAATPTTEGAVKEFADRYGSLAQPGVPTGLGVSYTVNDPAAPQGRRLAYGESLHDWSHHIRMMGVACELWDWVRTEDIEGLARVIVWAEDDHGRPLVIHFRPLTPQTTYQPVIASAEVRPELLERFEPGAVIEPARVALARLISGYMRAAVRLVCSPDDFSHSLQYRPDDLLAGMWLQLARVVAAGVEQRPCQVCGKHFDVGPLGSRTDRLFCGAACRNKSYRERQERARALAAEGRSAREIARELGADIDTIKGWIKGPKKGD